jgi:predicted nucleic acid-binding Zn ribbon protein
LPFFSLLRVLWHSRQYITTAKGSGFLSLNKLLRYFQSSEDLAKQIERVTVTRDKFMACLDNFCDKMKIERKESKFCVNCGEPIESGKTLCVKCSAVNANICPICGTKVKAKDVFCMVCGRKLK